MLDGGTIEIHGDGQQIRTFTYVTDTVDGFVRALRTPEARGEMINIGGTEPTQILDLAELVQTTLSMPLPLRAKFVPYESMPGRYQDVLNRVPDTTKARRLLGFEAKVPLDIGLAYTAEWHCERRQAEEALQA